MTNHKTMIEILHRALTRATLERETRPAAALKTLRGAILDIKAHSQRANVKPLALVAVEREIYAQAYTLLETGAGA